MNWGLRDYGTTTWEGGDPNCNHKIDPGKLRKQTSNKGTIEIQYKKICLKCDARQIDLQLGLEKTPEEYVEKMVEIFREIKRVLKKDGTVWLNLGDSYAQSGSGTGESNSEVIRDKTYKHYNFRGAKYVEQKNPKTAISGLKPKDLTGIPWRVAFALQADGWYLRQDIIWAKPNPMPESVTDRCTKAHEYVFLLTKSAKYWYDANAIKEDSKPESLERYKYNFTGYPGDIYPNEKRDLPFNFNGQRDVIGRNKRSVWTVTTQPYSEAHFATFPEALIEPMILAGCPEQVCIKCGKARERILKPSEEYEKNLGSWQIAKSDKLVHNKAGNWTDCDCNAGFEPGIIYDPFMGAGTVAKVTLRANRQFIGSELSSEYVKMANKRIESLLKQYKLF